MPEWLWKEARHALTRHCLSHLLSCSPLVTRETNLKFRQAPMITHHELTSIRKIASFQGGSWQTHPAPLGPVSPPAVGPQVPHLLGGGCCAASDIQMGTLPSVILSYLFPDHWG